MRRTTLAVALVIALAALAGGGVAAAKGGPGHGKGHHHGQGKKPGRGRDPNVEDLRLRLQQPAWADLRPRREALRRRRRSRRHAQLVRRACPQAHGTAAPYSAARTTQCAAGGSRRSPGRARLHGGRCAALDPDEPCHRQPRQRRLQRGVRRQPAVRAAGGSRLLARRADRSERRHPCARGTAGS